MMRPTAIKGDHAVAYYDALVTDPVVAQKRSRVEDYYLSTGEQPGLWWGQAARELGLMGVCSRQDFRALMAGLDPRSGEPLGRGLRRDGVRGFDLTFSAPKSVSVLSALCGGEVEREVIAAHDAAVAAVMRVIEERASTRRGINGVFRVDVAGVAVLLVRHRTSRALDPQLHTHAVVASRVRGVDGVWRALDASMLYRDQRMLGGLYQAGLRAELTARLGVAWTPVVKGQAEIAGMPAQLLEAFSRRAAQIRDVVASKAQRFGAGNGREPSRREWAIMIRDAARESRPPKQRGRGADRLRSEWLATAGAHRYQPRDVWRAVVKAGETQAVGARRWLLGAAGRAMRAGERQEERLADGVLAALVIVGSAWTQADIEREVAARLPIVDGAGALDQIREVQLAAQEIIVDWCVDLAPPSVAGVVRAVLDEPGVQRYSTRGLVEQEQRIVRWLAEAAAGGGEPAVLDARVGAGLDPEQAQAAALVAGTAGVVVVVGPAGAGKTRAIGGAVAALSRQGRVVLGLAPSAAAAGQLEREAGVGAETVARFLTEHELPDGQRGPLDLPAGATLIVDEAGMLGTGDMERLLAIARARRYRVALVGDSRQLAAVGRGGMFEHARAIAPAVQMAEVRRFTDEWEGRASLSLRDCDPGALDLYEEHERIRSGTAEQMRAAILEHWWQSRRAGRSLALTVASNDQARALNERAHQRLIEAGLVDDGRVIHTSGRERVGVGDEVQTRHNERRLRTETGRWVKNRQRWHVEQINGDGSLQVRGPSGHVTLPADYAREHVQLAYFQTVHSSQGATRDEGATLIDQLSGWRSVYVGMTRGRHQNTAYVVVEDPDETARDVLDRALRRDRADLGVLAIQRALVADARRLTQQRTRELQAERDRLSATPQHQARLQAIDQELEQLTAASQQRNDRRRQARTPSRLLARQGRALRL